MVKETLGEWCLQLIWLLKSGRLIKWTPDKGWLLFKAEAIGSQQKYPSATPWFISASEVSGSKLFLDNEEGDTKIVFQKQILVQLIKHITLNPQI